MRNRLHAGEQKGNSPPVAGARAVDGSLNAGVKELNFFRCKFSRFETTLSDNRFANGEAASDESL
jgi:hypothetical protein